MTIEERVAAFQAAIEAATAQFGIEIHVEVTVERLGHKVLTGPGVIYVPVQDWSEPDADPLAPHLRKAEAGNGVPAKTSNGQLSPQN